MRLRAAVVKLEQDKDYLDEANKVMGDVPEYATGPTINDDVRRGLTIRPELREFMDAYAKRVTSILSIFPARQEATMEGKLQFADLEAFGPGTPAGRPAAVLAPGAAGQGHEAATGRPVEIMGEHFTLYRGEVARPIWSTSVARIAVCSCRSAGSRATISAAAITAGVSTAAANAWSSRPTSTRMRTGSGCQSIRRANISGSSLPTSAKARLRSFSTIPISTPGRRHHRCDRNHSVHLLEQARQRHRAHSLG